MKQILVKIKQDTFYFAKEEDCELFRATVPPARLNPCYKAWDYLQEQGWFHAGFYSDGNYKKEFERGSDSEEFLVWKKPENDAEELELCLKTHDWYYAWSDDYRVYNTGIKERNKIEQLMDKVGEPQAVKIYNQFTPENMKRG